MASRGVGTRAQQEQGSETRVLGKGGGPGCRGLANEHEPRGAQVSPCLQRPVPLLAHGEILASIIRVVRVEDPDNPLHVFPAILLHEVP